jgi:hypothetical protein
MNVAKKEKIYISIHYAIVMNVLQQTFEFIVSNRKILDYCNDSRYLVNKTINKIITDSNLTSNTLTYINRIDVTNGVTVFYEIKEPIACPSSIIKTIDWETPPYRGCKYCTEYKVDDGFSFCQTKKKMMKVGGIKSCPVFSQKEGE